MAKVKKKIKRAKRAKVRPNSTASVAQKPTPMDTQPPRPAAAPTKRKRARGPGRVPGNQKLIGPEQLEFIARKTCEGVPREWIAQALDISSNTVRYHLDTYIRPVWAENMSRPAAEEIAKIDNLERTAWERFKSDAPSEVREMIESGVMPTSSSTRQRNLRVLKKVLATVKRPGLVAWLDIIKWCIGERNKMLGNYAPERHDHRMDGELRVAGLDREGLDDLMTDRLAKAIVTRRATLEASRLREN